MSQRGNGFHRVQSALREFDPKECRKVLCRLNSNFFSADSAQFADGVSGIHDVRGLVTLAAVRYGREIRTVGLNEKAVGGDEFGGIPDILCLGLSQIAGE